MVRLVAALAAVAACEAAIYCAKDAAELTKCNAMVTIINGQTPKPAEAWTCVQKDDTAGCVAAIKAGGATGADLTSVGASEVFKASEDFGAQVVAGELLEQTAAAAADAAVEYYAIAVVKKDFDMTKKWESLRGAKSCHTGYGKTSGWTMPLGRLLREKVFTEINTDEAIPNDTEIITDFFSSSCAPNGAADAEDGVNRICTGCEGDCGGDIATEPFYDYEGSFACLKAGGDVSFTKAGVIPAAEEADYLLVCPDGSTAPLSDYLTCNLAKVPSHTVITRGDVDLATLTAWQTELVTASKLPTFTRQFWSATGNPDSLLFDSGAKGLEALAPSAINHIGEAYVNYRFLASNELAPVSGAGGVDAPATAVTTAAWCVDADAKPKCEEMVEILNKVGKLEWSCITVDDTDKCIEAMEGEEGAAGTPDAAVVGASTAVAAAEAFGSQLVISEDLGSDGRASPTEYYGIAVVKKDFDMSKGWESLRGKKSCHTGYRKTSGWTIPVGFMLSEGILSYAGNTDPDTPNDIYAVQEFFQASCAPSPEDKPEDGVNGVCTACAGDCSQTEKEEYQDYPGAFACLKAGGGDVAFTKQGVVPVSEEGDYLMVCADGRTQPLANFESCNLARVPARAVLTGGQRSPARIAALAADLQAGAADPDFQALFFEEGSNPDGLVFSEGIQGLTPLPSSSVIAAVGDAAFAYQSIARSDTTERQAESGDDGKTAETAAIVLGVLLAVLLLAASALIFRMKKSNRRLSKELAKATGQSQEWGTTHATKA